MRRACFVIFLMMFLATGCTMRLVDFTLISTKNIDLARGAEFVKGKCRVEGKDMAQIIIIIPTGNPNIKEAIDNAIESVPGAIALLDGVITSKFWYIPYIYGQTKYIVEGTPLIDPKLTAQKLPSNYIVSMLDKKGKVIETKYVSKEEFERIKKTVGLKRYAG